MNKSKDDIINEKESTIRLLILENKRYKRIITHLKNDLRVMENRSYQQEMVNEEYGAKIISLRDEIVGLKNLLKRREVEVKPVNVRKFVKVRSIDTSEVPHQANP